MKSSMSHAVIIGCLSLAIGASALPASAQKARPSEGGTKMSDQELRQKLTPEQYRVTQEDGTERAFANEYWDNHEAGIYVDVVSGEPLFASIHKYDSGTGWPSFTQPLVADNIVEKQDRSWFVATPRSARRAPTPTSATSSTTGPRRPACATA